MINLNHINLSLPDVTAARQFFEKYFDFQPDDAKPNETLSVLKGPNGFILVLMNERLNKNGNNHYPDAFHIGFYLNDTIEVDSLFARLTADGIPVEQHPQKIRKTYGFYFYMQNILVEIATQLNNDLAES